MTILISRDTLHSICSGPVGTSAAVKGSDNDGMQLKTICGHISKTAVPVVSGHFVLSQY